MLSSFTFLFFLFLLPSTPRAAYNVTDYILLNCGASQAQPDASNRQWGSDARTRYAPPNADDISLSVASSPSSLVPEIPYSTARVFRSPFTYTFPVLAGHKFLRLYFYPANFSGADASQFFFNVTANGYTLLRNFSAFLNSDDANPSFYKEFIINVEADQRINLTFTPNQGSSAFINGIEIVSLPDTLYYRNAPLKFVNQLYDLTNNTALETFCRLNVGGSDVRIQNDTGMFRYWTIDDNYIFGADFGYTPHDETHVINYTSATPPYTAPEIVYRTSRVMGNTSKSLDWEFPLHSGFYYLFRLHFCEIQLEITRQNQRVFTIRLNNETAQRDLDVIFLTGGTGIPVFEDYITFVPDDGRRGKTQVRLSLFPNLEGQPMYSSALLNGLEIFKLSDDDRSLAAANDERRIPESETQPPVHKKNRKSSLIYAIIGSVIGVVAIIAVLCFFLRRKQRVGKVKDSVTTKSSWVPLPTDSRSTVKTSGSGMSLPSDLCRHFSLEEIMIATEQFDEKLVIGRGGFGNVYKGLIDEGTTVAVKRLNSSSNQGAREFMTEIEMLSKLRHVHLVSLIGYCDENGEMILVYDYMEHGTFRDHLYNSGNPPLKWNQRLQICLGAAKGLEYLHTGAKHSVIHRDVKSTNILLDEKWVAKMSDFGLSKVGPTGGAHTHVSTVVKGSFGYLDPEYYRRQQLTDKSDVYSFGVVLFEALCARQAINTNLPKEKVNLAEWAKTCYKKGNIEKIIDPNLKGKIAPECLSKYVETAIMCLKDKGIERPAMNDVVWSLEFAIQQQETVEKEGGIKMEMEEESESESMWVSEEGKDGNSTEMFSCSSETVSSGVIVSSSGQLKSHEIFSELNNPIGR